MCSEQEHHAIITQFETNDGGITQGLALTAFLIKPEDADDGPTKMVVVRIDTHGVTFQLMTKEEPDVAINARLSWDDVLEEIKKGDEAAMQSSFKDFNTVADLFGDIEQEGA